MKSNFVMKNLTCAFSNYFYLILNLTQNLLSSMSFALKYVVLTPFKKAIKGITKINSELLRVSDIMSI